MQVSTHTAAMLVSNVDAKFNVRGLLQRNVLKSFPIANIATFSPYRKALSINLHYYR